MGQSKTLPLALLPHYPHDASAYASIAQQLRTVMFHSQTTFCAPAMAATNPARSLKHSTLSFIFIQPFHTRTWPAPRPAPTAHLRWPRSPGTDTQIRQPYTSPSSPKSSCREASLRPRCEPMYESGTAGVYEIIECLCQGVSWLALQVRSRKCCTSADRRACFGRWNRSSPLGGKTGF